MSKEKPVGFFGYLPGGNVICDGDSCVITGSVKKMKKLLSEYGKHDIGNVVIKKTRFKEIRTGLESGAAYSFDEESYCRFQPAALKAGIDVGPEDFSEERPGGFHLVRVQKFCVSGN